MRDLLSLLYVLRWFILFGALGFYFWLYFWTMMFEDWLTGAIGFSLLCFYFLVATKVGSEIFAEFGNSRAIRCALILLNCGATLSALVHLHDASVRDFGSATGLWSLAIGLALMSRATQISEDRDFSRFGWVIHVRAKGAYWAVCLIGFIFAFQLHTPVCGQMLKWWVAVVIFAVGAGTLPLPRWLSVMIERIR